MDTAEWTKVTLLLHIDMLSRVWTILLVRTVTTANIVDTTLSCARRHHLLLEEMKRTLSRNRLTRLINQPTQDIEVVARLGKDNRGGSLRIRPVASHIRVCKVAVLHRL